MLFEVRPDGTEHAARWLHDRASEWSARTRRLSELAERRAAD